MRSIKKAYCRGVQTLFYAAMPFLPYRDPYIFGDIYGLVRFLSRSGISSVLLVTDSSLREMGATSELEGLLGDDGIKCAVYDGVCANPTVENVEQARLIYIRNECDCIIAFGGGSSIDCAKAAGARIA